MFEAERTDLKRTICRLKTQFNDSQTKWTPSSSRALNSILRNTQTTITVNWSGGGRIKPSEQELSSLLDTYVD